MVSFSSTLSSRPRQIYRATMRASSSQITGAGTFVCPTSQGTSAPGASTAGWAFFELEKEDYDLAPKQTLLRLSARVLINDVALGTSLRFALFPVATSVGTAGNGGMTLGAEVPDSGTVTLVTPAANSISGQIQSPDFACPATGIYVVGIVASGAFAAGAVASMPVRLEAFNL